MVLETLTGATLDALLEEGPLSVADTALLGLQLASVLGYLHRKGWLHLDLKPANVVVEQGRATLIDLSLAGPRRIGTAAAPAPAATSPPSRRSARACRPRPTCGGSASRWWSR